MTHRLLIVDDNSAYRTLVRYALADCAIKVVGEASTTTAGIARARELQPDLVLLDIVHRGEDAVGAIRPLQEAAPTATIVAVAAYAEHELWSRAPNVHNVAYLPKSTLPTRLCEELVRILSTRHDTDDIEATFRERFPADLRSARAARRFVSGVLEGWGFSGLVDEAVLLVSELVTNAVIHAHSNVELAVHRRATRVRIEVIDTARDHVRRRDAQEDAQSGRGMALIEVLAAAWGIDSLLSGKSVWFELGRPDLE